MELTVALAISILSAVMTVTNFVVNRKDKSNKDTKDESYKWGKFDEKLENIEKVLSKIEGKLDNYDKELDIKIEKAISLHVEAFHKGQE